MAIRKKAAKNSRPKFSDPMSAAIAAECIRAVFAKEGGSMNENEVDHLADIITSKGTSADALVAFRALPMQQAYAFARIMLLRRTWMYGKAFLRDPWMRQQYGKLSLTPDEQRKMRRHFGDEATDAFFEAASAA